jgi:hypothetical protein
MVSGSTDIARIAVPEALLQDDGAELPDILIWYRCIAGLFIIVDAQPDLQFEENDMHVLRRWELDSTQGRAFFWNADHNRFDSEDSKCIGNEALYRRIEEATNGLGENLVQNELRSFEIRPVIAARR